jgi:hypothetical protein
MSPKEESEVEPMYLGREKPQSGLIFIMHYNSIEKKSTMIESIQKIVKIISTIHAHYFLPRLQVIDI